MQPWWNPNSEDVSEIMTQRTVKEAIAINYNVQITPHSRAILDEFQHTVLDPLEMSFDDCSMFLGQMDDYSDVDHEELTEIGITELSMPSMWTFMEKGDITYEPIPVTVWNALKKIQTIELVNKTYAGKIISVINKTGECNGFLINGQSREELLRIFQKFYKSKQIHIIMFV